MNSLDDPGDGINLNESGQVNLDFLLNVNDKNFDNDDNPYGSFVYHMYTNMEHINDTDVAIPEDEGNNTESS